MIGRFGLNIRKERGKVEKVVEVFSIGFGVFVEEFLFNLVGKGKF